MVTITSTFTEGPLEADGRRYVHERHVFDDGTVAEFSWLGAQDAQPVVDARAVRLKALKEEKLAAEAMVLGCALPLSRLEFLSRLTPAERVAIRTAAKTDPVVEDIMAMFDAAQQVVTAHPQTVQTVQYLVAAGLLSAARADEVLA